MDRYVERSLSLGLKYRYVAGFEMCFRAEQRVLQTIENARHPHAFAVISRQWVARITRCTQ
jgi:hypothetical protein